MYQLLSPADVAVRRREALAEAQRARLVAQLGPPPASRPSIRWSKRTVPIAALAVAAALLLAGGAALAKSIDCAGGPCRGTPDDDVLQGTAAADQFNGRGGADLLIEGPQAPGPTGDDVLRGGGGDDSIGANSGGEPDSDQVFGGKGKDFVSVAEFDSSVDRVDCGPGKDKVAADPTDVVVNCEKVILAKASRHPSRVATGGAEPHRSKTPPRSKNASD